jgi:pimeloyl-ACP methyl ester carboxylesterase
VTTADVPGRARSADGVEVAYTTVGAGEAALVFIHGGLADRTFWAPQLRGLEGFRRVALDLAGHGESGKGRAAWTIPAFGEDVRAVVDAAELRRVVLVGNSLGGAVALEAARLLSGRACGVVGVDTLHDLRQTFDPAEANARAHAFRKDFRGTCRAMVGALFHPGAQPELRAWAEARMLAMSPEIAAGMMAGFGGYDLAAAARAAEAPVRAINGDLWPTLVERNRDVVPGFDAVIIPGAGHYLMLERPDEFNRALEDMARELLRAAAEPTSPSRPRS